MTQPYQPGLDPVRKKTVFGLDYDGTVTRDVGIWRHIVALLRQAGHDVYIVTMRFPSERDNYHTPMDPVLMSLVNDVVFTSRQAKGEFMRQQGVAVDVWIEDTPQAVHLSASQIWGTCSPEGEVVVPEDPTTNPVEPLPIHVLNANPATPMPSGYDPQRHVTAKEARERFGPGAVPKGLPDDAWISRKALNFEQREVSLISSGDGVAMSFTLTYTEPWKFTIKSWDAPNTETGDGAHHHV